MSESLKARLMKEFQVQISMVDEANRLATFKKWVYDKNAPCNAQKMAEAGFYSLATKDDPDLVQCFVCGKALDGWDKSDDPWIEHLKHQRDCTFAILRKPEEHLTLSEYADVQRDMVLNMVDKYYADESASEDNKMEWYLDGFEQCREKKY